MVAPFFHRRLDVFSQPTPIIRTHTNVVFWQIVAAYGLLTWSTSNEMSSNMIKKESASGNLLSLFLYLTT